MQSVCWLRGDKFRDAPVPIVILGDMDSSIALQDILQG